MAAEKQFENKIKRYLDSKDIWYVKFFANAFTKSGIPDLLACINSYFVAIEVKASNGKPSELQLYNRDKIRKHDGICIILYPEQFEEFKQLVDDLLNNRDLLAFKHQYNFDKR